MPRLLQRRQPVRRRARTKRLRRVRVRLVRRTRAAHRIKVRLVPRALVLLRNKAMALWVTNRNRAHSRIRVHRNDNGQDLLQQAKQTTSEVVNQVQQRAGYQINRQKETAASELSTVVNAVRRFGETLNNEGNGPIARFAAQYGDKAANSLDRFATYLRDQDPKRLLDDVQKFGRRQPALVDRWRISSGFRRSTSHQVVDGGSLKQLERTPVLNVGRTQELNHQWTPELGHQPFNTNVSGAQTSTSPNRI